MENIVLEDQQRIICQKFGSEYVSSPKHLKIGISSNARDGVTPINGLRHKLDGETTGWYIWAGEELSGNDDFFKPLHVAHLDEWCPQIKKYLGLAPGWRFLIAENYEDVWFDETLLET